MENIEDIIRTFVEQEPHLCHASCLLKQLTNTQQNSKDKDKVILKSIANQYVHYIRCNNALIGYTSDIVAARVSALNEYYDFLHNNNYENVYNPQTKLRPTILEEFLFLLFRDLVHEYQSKYNVAGTLDSGSAKSYTNLYFKAKDFDKFIVSPEVATNVKDQDFAIFRYFKIGIDNQTPQKVAVPAIVVEAKTFIDKTMLDSIIATAEKIKNGNPYARFVAVAEKYDVGSDVDPAYSRIDQIYILRKCSRRDDWSPIDQDVVLRFFNETKEHIERPWSDVQNRMKESGIII